jgi:hypothetical protein
MDIEIFDERELDSDLKVESDEEALALMKELGFKDQDTSVRVCYPRPTAEQGFILRVLFPTMTKLTDYTAGAIPVRVLKEARSYMQEFPEHRLFVLSEPPATVVDPVLIACDSEHTWMNDDPARWRLIARWGNALESWDKLLVKASDFHRADIVDKLKKYLAIAESAKLTRRVTISISGLGMDFS